MDGWRRVKGGLAMPIHDRKYLALRAGEVSQSRRVLEHRSCRLQRHLERADSWLERTRLLALLALSLAVVGLWLVTLWIVLFCWLAAGLVRAWKAHCAERLQRVRRQADLCRVELSYLRCQELFVPVRVTYD